ncbi:lymphocyte-specific protein 1 [Cricetulus griseus]|uniref:Lymphocyte-specific protein 1 n=1 Tax=Cricetulus griseus TaxID=10029 RepID=A0A061IF45_CRIGR|nr:lymphocyte-specific protein 1 [Cricetulus griseus]
MAEAASDPSCEEQEELHEEDSKGLTTQWREEDKEEAAREQRQRERERQLQDQDQDKVEDEGDHSLEQPEQQALLSLKSSELDEDEGFGDWSQKMEQRQQCWENEGTAEGTEPSQNESPEETQAEDRQVWTRLDKALAFSDSSLGLDNFFLSQQVKVHLEELNLSQEEPSPEDTVGSCEEAEENLASHQARTPSPLALEETVEPSSPPLSPTTTLADRTESLNRSIKKSNSVKKSQPTLPISTIDERLQQYTQATESAGRTPKLSRQPSIELPSMAVASTKTRWETGEVQTQSASKTPSCQDIVAGDMSKKSLWEQKGSSKISSTIKSTPSGKRYKFVATGHGKYEKVLVDEGSAP